MKFKFKTQDYQEKAVSNICKVFSGQPYQDMLRYTRDMGIRSKAEINASLSLFESAFEQDDSGFENAKILIDDNAILNNIKKIQEENDYKVSDALIKSFGKCSLDIEMETGTGKTYVYIKSIFELNKRYGWSKFIIIVPSIAIREGVKKSFSMMEDHFMDEYGKKARYFIYNSKKLTELESFASSNSIQVMIINVQAFNARGEDARRIDMVLDEFQSRKPIDVIAKTRPILILDEPQKMSGETTQNSLKKFNSLFNMNFSATHKKIHNLVYRLDALDAYNNSLVKKIQVKGFEVKNLRGTDDYLYLQDVILSKDKPPMAKIEFEINYKNGIKRESRILGKGRNLYPLSAGKNMPPLEQYKNGYVISDINAYNNTVTLLNGKVIALGEIIDNDDSDANLRRIQIKETILSHFEKEKALFEKGIKCLSLFFIDEVVKYRDYSKEDEKGQYAKIFEEEYKKVLNEYLTLEDCEYLRYIKNISAEDTHKGYFSIDKKGHFIDSKENRQKEGSDDISAYDLILKNKERLLSFEEPTRFIFSHSALREGWDNPNVFQICALKPGGDSGIAKRQEVGRGLRICVNKYGDRIDLGFCKARQEFLNINRLTVIATDSYKDFVADIQKDIKENLADRPTKATIDYFKGKVINDGENSIVVDDNIASLIYSYLVFSGYTDAKTQKLTKKYFEDKENGTLKEMPVVLSPYAESIQKLVSGIFDDSALDGMIENERNSGIKENPLNENFNKKEFQALWNQINHKYTYTVEFNSDELIRKCVESINEKLSVNKLEYVKTIGEQLQNMNENQLGNGESFKITETKREKQLTAVFAGTKYDLIGKIKEITALTRKTISKILQMILRDKFELFKANPEEFISKVSKLINEEKATMIVDHITYNMTDGKYDNNIFTANQVKTDIKKVFESKKAIQDYIVTDGNAEKSKEKQFAEDLETASEVCVYAKLPRSFQIPTPVGDYAPDWAIAFNDNCGIKHIYFVAETKGSMETMELRGIEKAKTDCVRKLFNDFRLAGKARYEVVNSYSQLLDVMKAIE